jgi:DNA-binding response OmpR family regulator
MCKVLLIDDDAAMRAMISRMVGAAGHEVVEAANGVAGLELFRDHRPELVITDILMPQKDGLETVREIRQIDPTVRIIAISGGGAGGYTNFLRIAQSFGATETLQKPFRQAELLAKIEGLMSRAAV